MPWVLRTKTRLVPLSLLCFCLFLGTKTPVMTRCPEGPPLKPGPAKGKPCCGFPAIHLDLDGHHCCTCPWPRVCVAHAPSSTKFTECQAPEDLPCHKVQFTLSCPTSCHHSLPWLMTIVFYWVFPISPIPIHPTPCSQDIFLKPSSGYDTSLLKTPQWLPVVSSVWPQALFLVSSSVVPI